MASIGFAFQTTENGHADSAKRAAVYAGNTDIRLDHVLIQFPFASIPPMTIPTREWKPPAEQLCVDTLT